MKIIDDFLPRNMADHLEAYMLSRDFPWYFLPDITHGAEFETMTPAMSHVFFHELNGASNYFNTVISLPYMNPKEAPLAPAQIIRAVGFLQFPTMVSKPNNKHIDSPKPHKVLLYYVNDSDGHTVLYDGDNVIERIPPKKNRAIVFDGNILHASSRPTKNARCVINFNLTTI